MGKVVSFFSMLFWIHIAYAAVTVDENGVGFVGKGDVQSIYGWNNADLQANAKNIVFRLSTPASATWVCAGYNGANKYTTMKKSSELSGVTSTVSYTARKNPQAQVTGFILTGRNVNVVQGHAVGECPPAKGWVVQPQLIPDSVQYESTGDYLLEVSNGDGVWHELVITPPIVI